MNDPVKRIGIILLASGVAAVVANSVHPRRIPWVQDWSRYVEAKEAKAAKHKGGGISYCTGLCVAQRKNPTAEHAEYRRKSL